MAARARENFLKCVYLKGKRPPFKPRADGSDSPCLGVLLCEPERLFCGPPGFGIHFGADGDKLAQFSGGLWLSGSRGWNGARRAASAVSAAPWLTTCARDLRFAARILSGFARIADRRALPTHRELQGGEQIIGDAPSPGVARIFRTREKLI
jgi:hypothetical protein